MNNNIKFINFFNGHKFFAAVYLFFFLFIILPVFYIFANTFLFDNSLVSNIKQLDKNTFLLLLNSSIVAFVVSLFATFIGSVLGFLLYKTNLKYKGFFKILFLIPLLISPYILAVAWKDFFSVFFQNAKIISSYFGVVLVQVFIYTPLAMIIVGNAFTNIDAHLEESGLLITNVKDVILKIELPLIKPAIFSSFVLIFIFTISGFSVPAFFGIRVFTTEIFTQFSAFYNHSLAILQSFLLVAVCVFLLLTESKYISNASFLSVGSKGTNKKLFPSNNTHILFLTIWFLISVILPFITLVVQSFSKGTSDIIKAFDLLESAVGNSIGFALLASALIVIVGFVAAYYSNTQTKSSSNFFDWSLLIVFTIPSIVFGIALIKFYNRVVFNFIYSGYAIIVIAYVGKFSFIASKIIGNAIKQIPQSLDEAAQIEGISFYSRIKNILLPLILPGIFASFIIGFIFSFGELGTTIMVYPPGTEIMPIKVFTIMANAPLALTSSMTLIVLSVTIFMIAILYSVSKIFMKNYGFYND